MLSVMRFGRYIAIEILVVLAVFGLGGVGIVRGGSAAIEHFWALQRGVVGQSAPARFVLSEVPVAFVRTEPSGMFLGMSDDLLLARVADQPVVATKLNRGGSSISFRLEFADGSRAAFKPAQTNLQSIPRKEVAAYRINRLLGLNAVPPAIPRSLSRDELLANLHPESRAMVPRILAETIFDRAGRTVGMAQYWIPKIIESGLDSQEGITRSFGWLTIGNDIRHTDRSMAAQVSNLVVFDFITDNPDRYSGGNMKMSPDGDKLYFMDNTMAFYLRPDGSEATRKSLLRSQRFSRSLYEKLDRLTPTAIRSSISESGIDPEMVLTAAETRAVVSRQQFVKRHIDDLIAHHGEPLVLLFP